jgi:branched-chain amino acid transport system substrate-binding protein
MVEKKGKRTDYSVLTRRTFLKTVGIATGTLAIGGFEVFAKEGPIAIGVLSPMTGSLAAFGPYLTNACELAKDHVNKAGGPLGRELKLIHRDSQTDPTAAVDAATKLVTIDKVPAIVGGFSSAVALAAARPVIDNQVVMICTAATSPEITFLDDNDFVFRATIANDAKGVAQAKVAKAIGINRASTIYVNNAYGLALTEHFEKEMKQLGGSVPAAVPYDHGKPSYASEIEKATKGDPDAVFLIGYVEDGITILRQMIGLGYKGKLLLGDGMKSPDIIQKIGAKYLEGASGVAPTSFSTDSRKFFEEEYKKKFNEAPGKPFMDGAYDATIAIALAIHKAGKATGVAIRDNLRAVTNPPGEEISAAELKRAFALISEGRKINYQGASGVFDFDKYGSTFTAIEIWKVENGKFKTVTKVNFDQIPATLKL